MVLVIVRSDRYTRAHTHTRTHTRIYMRKIDERIVSTGSSNGHSPVLNLSKTAGSGSVGEHSGSEAEASHRSQDDEEEDDNLSEDLDDDNEKDEGEIGCA